MVAPQDPALLDRLAAEYVLGTLRCAARRRLERWRAGSDYLEERCRFWEQRLLQLCRDLRPCEPAPQVWRGVQRGDAAAHGGQCHHPFLVFRVACGELQPADIASEMSQLPTGSLGLLEAFLQFGEDLGFA